MVSNQIIELGPARWKPGPVNPISGMTCNVQVIIIIIVSSLLLQPKKRREEEYGSDPTNDSINTR